MQSGLQGWSRIMDESRMLKQRGRKQRRITVGTVLVAVYLVLPFALTAQTAQDRSIPLNDLQTLWTSYKWYIVGGLALILAQTAFIIQVLWLRARRKMQ